MDKIIDALVKLIPFAEQFEKWGLGKEASTALAGLAIVVLGVAVKALYKSLTERYKNSKAARDLAPYFTYQQVKASRELFIPTQFQNQSPTHEEEPEFSHRFVSKSPLIPFFLKIAFNEKKESDKFYLILADSGMGKTTFMINLYVHYTAFFNFRRKYKIRLYPFGDARILEQIKKIEPTEARDTILLLDAFDEDRKLIPPEQPDGGPSADGGGSSELIRVQATGGGGCLCDATGTGTGAARGGALLAALLSFVGLGGP